MKHRMFKTALLATVGFFSLLIQSCSKSATTLIDLIAAGKSINLHGLTTVTVTCPAGKQMVGGGYSLGSDQSNQSNIEVVASFPSSKNTWEVDVISNQTSTTANTAQINAVLYFYTGSDNIGMGFSQTDTTFFSGPAAGFSYLSFTGTVAKPYSFGVVTSGGFKISPGSWTTGNITVMGSYPQLIPNKNGGTDVTGWMNNVNVTAGTTGTITNFIMYSTGKIQEPQNIPVFDQEETIHNTASGANVNLEAEGKKGYFCTGGGYNVSRTLTQASHSLSILQNNATTTSGIYFGWQFSAFDLFSNSYWVDHADVYALQLKLH